MHLRNRVSKIPSSSLGLAVIGYAYGSSASVRSLRHVETQETRRKSRGVPEFAPLHIASATAARRPNYPGVRAWYPLEPPLLHYDFWSIRRSPSIAAKSSPPGDHRYVWANRSFSRWRFVRSVVW